MKSFDEWFSTYGKVSTEYSDRDICRDAFKAGMLAAADIAEPIFENAYPHGNKTVSEVIADEIRIVANAD